MRWEQFLCHGIITLEGDYKGYLGDAQSEPLGMEDGSPVADLGDLSFVCDRNTHPTLLFLSVGGQLLTLLVPSWRPPLLHQL